LGFLGSVDHKALSILARMGQEINHFAGILMTAVNNHVFRGLGWVFFRPVFLPAISLLQRSC
jgi:hypothetical protein